MEMSLTAVSRIARAMRGFTAGAEVCAAVACMLSYSVEEFTVLELSRLLGCDQYNTRRALEKLESMDVISIARNGDGWRVSGFGGNGDV